MVAAKNNNNSLYSLSEMEVKYKYITSLYDLADDLLSSVDSKFVTDQEAQLKLVEPLVNEIGDAADILCEEFIHISDNQRGGSRKISKPRIENALRRIYNSLASYHEQVRNNTKKTSSLLRNIADTVVKKIEQHLEEIVIIFMTFVQLSLASIMHKQQLEAVRANNSRIAMMMHQHSMSQQ